MDPRSVDEPAVPQGEKEQPLDLKFKIVAQAFLELFELLQDYAPVWYTEQHYNRALAAYRVVTSESENSARSPMTRDIIGVIGKLSSAGNRRHLTGV
jgi:hypothetical protein